MNILIIRQPNEAVDFTLDMLARRRPGTTMQHMDVIEDQAQFLYTLRNLPQGNFTGPNVMVCPIEKPSAVGQPYIRTVATVAARDKATLIVLVPQLETAEQEIAAKAQDNMLFSVLPDVFILHCTPLVTKSNDMAGMVLKLADSGMFGRYRAYQQTVRNNQAWSIAPLLARHSLLLAAPPC